MYFFIGTYVTIVFLALLWLYLHVTRNFNHWKNLGIPYIKPIPLFGNIYKVFMLKSSIGDFVYDLHNSVKTATVGFFVFDQPYLLIRDPELVKQVLIKDFDYFEDRSIVENRPHDELASNVLFIVKNPTWKSIRSKLTPVFTSGKMKNMLPLLIEASEDLKGYIQNIAVNSESTEAREIAMKYTTDVISSCAFGINAHSFKNEDAEFRVASRRLFDWNIRRAISMSSYFFAPTLAKLFGLKFIDPTAGNFLRTVFWKHMNERENLNSTRGDLIDLLIQLRKTSEKNKLDDEVIVAQAVQFFMAGFETTGSTITFALYLLAKNPSVQDKLYQEIKKVMKQHRTISYEALQEMKYMDRVLSETLRIYPVLPYLDRRCTKPYQLQGTNAVIQKGIPVYISLYGLHFDAQYFPDPFKFDPDRFTNENKAKRPAAVYLPFGDGPHNCIGARFAQLSAKVAFVQILYEYQVETCSTTPDPIKLDPKGVLLAPESGRLNLHFKKRAGGTM